MFYGMVNKCIIQWQTFSVFWQNTGNVEIFKIRIGIEFNLISIQKNIKLFVAIVG